MSDGNLSLTSQEKLNLASWGLPNSVLKKYAEKGVVNMFQWQVDCLCSPGVLSGGNLVYSAPTSAGKTLVAEMLAIKTILERKKKVFFILPFVSVVREKMFYFKELLGSCGVHVHGFMGSHVPPGGFKTTHLAVCTIEKANGLINRLVEERELEEVGCVIVDELHLLGDPHRGYLLELLLAKIKYVSSREAGVRVQIIGMSATLPNLNVLANWLDAALYCTEFRPVPLTEFLKVESHIYKASNLNCTSMKLPDFIIKDDPGDIIKLCIQTLLDGHSVLVFCPTKNWCEALAQQIASEIRKIGCGNSELSLGLRQQLNSNSISDLLEQLKRCPVGLESSIGKCVSFGVAYHHAGLTLDERDILENSFRQCVLRVLVATSTLSSGVNLPARRVIVRSPLFGGQPLDILSYKQMIGRAGRMGKDTAGESFLVCKETERKVGEKIVNAQLPSVESCLGLGNLSSSLKRAVLEVIASGVVTSLRDVKAYTACTLFAASQRADNLSDLAEPITACIEFLQKNQFIRVLEDDQLTPTNLGEACLSAALPPDQALRLLSELHKARQCFVLDSELHVIYQVTPFSVSEQWRQLDWMSALNLWENLSPSMQRVGELIGVEERFLVRAIRGNINSNSFAQMEKLSIFRRFYTALALQDLVHEMPLVKVAEKYKCSKGMLQSLQQSASTFAGMVTQFCRRLGWSSMELLVSQFSERLQFGVQRELIDLLRIDCISALQARALFNSNIQSLSQLATSRVEDVEKALRKAVPFESEEKSNNEESRNKKYVCLVGRTNLTEREAANLIINEARNFIQVELGLKSVDWINYSIVISEEDHSELTASSLKESFVVTSRNKLSNSSSRSGIPEAINSDITLGIVNKCDTIKSSVLNSPVILDEKYFNVKTSEKIVSNNCLDLNVEIGQNDVMNSPVLLNEDDLISKQSVSMKNDNIEVVESENLNEDLKCIDNSQKVKPNYRSSLDMFEESENSSSDEGDTKFKDVICSLSLYDSKISKISNEDDSTSDDSECIENEPKKISSNDKEVESKKNPVNNYIEKNEIINSSIKNRFELYSKENTLFDFNTQLENMLNKNWDSICNINNAGCINEKSCLNKMNVNKPNEESKEYKIESEEESEVLLRTPLLESKSVFDFSSKYGSRCHTRVMESSVKEKENVMKSKRPTNCRPMVYSSKKIKSPESILIESDEVLVPSSGMKLYLSPCVKTAKDIVPNEKESIEENILYSDSTFFNYLKGSTPANSPFVNKNVSSASSIDLFNNSPTSNVVQCNNVSVNSLDDVDVNWGGDSILQNSMLLLNTQEQRNSLIVDSVSKKRKHSLTNSDFICSKRMKLCDENFHKVSPCSNPVKIVDAGMNISKKVIFGKNDVIKNDHSVKQFSSDENSEIFIKSPFLQKSCGLYESLCIDSQMCNALDNVNVFNNNLSDNSVISNDNSIKFGTEKGLHHEKIGESSHDDFKKPCNTSVRKIRHVVNSVNEFKTPSIISGCSGNNYRPLKRNTSKNLIMNMKPKDSGSPKESNTSEFKISDSILEAAAGFQSMIDFKEGFSRGYPKINQDMTIHNSNKSNEGKGNEKRCVNSPLKYNTSNHLKFRAHASQSNETDSGVCDKTKSTSRRIIVDNCDTDGATKVLKEGLNVQKEKLNEEEKEEFDDLMIWSSQEDLHSISRVHTRSMLSRMNESVRLNKSSVSESNAVITENVCDRENNLEALKRNLARMKVISVALNVVKKGENLQEGIGARILARRNTRNEREGDFSFGSSVVCGMVIYWGGTETFYLDMRRSDCPCIQIIRELFLRDNITVIMFDLKSQIKLLHQCCQFTIKCSGSDPIIADWILSPSDRRKSLKQMVKLSGIKCPLINDDRNTVKEAIEIWYLDRYFHQKMKQAHLISAYTDIEMPVQFCLCNMEISGFGFDKDYAELLWDRVEIKMAELLEVAYQIAGRKFNPRSKADLNKIQKFLASTISENYQELDVLLSVIQKWRKLNSLKARSLSPVLLEAGTRLFGDCVTTTQTGRVSMHEPNLQNIPKDVIIDEEVFSMRTSFIPSPGFVLVSADYCQLELRILAHFSEDKALLEAFHSSSDIFIGIAAAWHNISETQVTAELRHHTKQICYGLIYGMGVTSLAEQMELSEQEAKEMMESFKAAYPTLQAYLMQCISQCRKTKEVRTLFNRVRFLPDIVNTNSTQRSQAERQAVNTTIQGSAADIAKLGMLKVECSFQKYCSSAHLVLQLHDELIYEVPSDEFNVAVKIIRKEMENACKLKVPLPVKVKAGPSWGQLEVLDIE